MGAREAAAAYPKNSNVAGRDTPPCEMQTVYAWRTLQEGVCELRCLTGRVPHQECWLWQRPGWTELPCRCLMFVCVCVCDALA
jgi:hypothetical protein